MNEMGKMLVGIGLAIALVGALLVVASRTGSHWGDCQGILLTRARDFRSIFR